MRWIVGGLRSSGRAPHVDIDRDAASRHGVTPATINNTLCRGAGSGVTASGREFHRTRG
jgi:multidrug efflux pump subunit AcrB